MSENQDKLLLGGELHLLQCICHKKATHVLISWCTRIQCVVILGFWYFNSPQFYPSDNIGGVEYPLSKLREGKVQTKV